MLGASLFNLNVTKMMILNLLSFCIGRFVRLLIDFAFYLLEPKYLVQNNQFFIKNMFDQYNERLSMNQKIIDSFITKFYSNFTLFVTWFVFY